MCFAWLLTILGKSYAQNADYDLKVNAYIERYKALAVMEQKRSGIPAAITLAQGIHETQAGTSELATMANNHFGIKCKKEWTGETFAHTDDAPNECFRKYSRSEDSYKDHSDYLSKSPRYAELFKLSLTDYAAWALGLKRCGYATNPRYAQVLIKIVEDYHLQEYTYVAMNGVDIGTTAAKAEIVPVHDAPPVAQPKPQVSQPTIAVTPPVTTASATSATVAAAVTEVPVIKQSSKIITDNTVRAEPVQTEAFVPQYGQLVKVNGLRAIFGRKGDTPLEYAYKADVRYSRFLEVNEIDERPLPSDMYLYLEKKNTRGYKAIHKVLQGESLFAIAQAEGMQIKSLMDLNMLEPGEEPAPGTVLELQKAVAVKPSVVKRGTPAVNQPVITQSRYPMASNIKVADELKEKKVETTVAVPVTTQIEPVVAAKPAEVIKDPTVEETGKPAAQPQPEVATPVVNTEVTTPVATTVNPPKPVEEPVQKKTDSVTTVGTTTVASSIIDPVATVEPLPIQNASSVSVDNKAVVINKVAEPEVKREEEPVDELDKLKRRFDKVLYAKDKTNVAPPATPVVTPQPRQDTIKPAPTADATQEKMPAPLAASNDPKKYYTVKKGDTGYSIAKANGITLRQLMEWNGLDFGDIQEGQKLRVKP